MEIPVFMDGKLKYPNVQKKKRLGIAELYETPGRSNLQCEVSSCLKRRCEKWMSTVVFLQSLLSLLEWEPWLWEK